ncbi:MAG: PD-(D/E)XK nuclease domain-containing protein [Candidatus Calescibacterium sp.]|nr:PD-(D/E)XK nuclease domain-containing protein [Candidatus Calescibacterium sp.]MDW8194657.1 PD-(D/E)XK nuclease domain-containing protein [Candidatus Calescibacterium sp.]
MFFYLSYPNYEVEVSLSSRIASLLARSVSVAQKLTLQLIDIFDNNQIELLPSFLDNLFAQVPFQWYTHTSGYEAFYCTIFYIFLTSTGFNVFAEDTSSRGNIDLTVLYHDTAYIFEFKVNRGKPIEQIFAKQYYKKYLHMSNIIAIGIVVDSSSESVKQFEIQRIR